MRKPTIQLVKDERLLSIWKAIMQGILRFVIAGQPVTIGYYPFLWIAITLKACLVSACSETSLTNKYRKMNHETQ